MDTWALDYWYWLVFGMILIIAEIFIPSFTIFWFGLGAIAIAIISMLLPIQSLTMQLLIWAVASALFTFLWFKIFRPHVIKRTNSSGSKEAILGESGDVIKPPVDRQPGIVRFSIPILGSDEWPFTSEEQVDFGDRVVIKEISGNTLIVKKRR
jgi:membrane protein implicated in regulation of membrane protease activity